MPRRLRRPPPGRSRGSGVGTPRSRWSCRATPTSPPRTRARARREASAAETTAETTAEAADQPEEEPLAAGVDLTEAEEEWAEESPRKKMDPFAIADAADFSGDWEDIDCKG